MPVLTREVSHLARRRHGVITTEQVLELGGTPQQLRRAVERGELIRRHTNVFRVAAVPPCWEQRVLEAVLAAGPGARASHRAAARLWALDGSTSGRPEVVTPRHLRSWASHLGRVHESTDLHLDEPTERLNIPCTGAVRTILDLGAVVPLERVQQAADDAVRRGLCDWDDLLHAAAVHSRRGRRGLGALRAVLEASYGSAVPDSHFNRLVERLLLTSDLPAPCIEHEVRDATGAFVARVDLAYPALRIAVELDSRRFHDSAQAFEHDRARQNRLELLGWVVLRYTWQQYIHSPTRLVSEVRAAVRARAAER